jgi:uncharacterized protein YybS (DUF2232 family)
MTNPWWLLSAGAGIASALLYGLAPASPPGAMMLSVLIPVPLFMAGLGLGAIAGALASAVAIAGVLILQGPMAGAIFAGGFAVPAAILVRQAMLSRTTDGVTVWYPAGLLTATLTVVGMGVAVAVTTIISSLEVQQMFDERLHAFAESFASSGRGEVTVEELLRKMEWTKRLLPGMMTSFLMLILLASSALAQSALEKMNRALRPWPDFAGMELPNWMAVVAAISVTAAMLLPVPAGTYAVAISFAVCSAFLLQGLAVVHAFNRKIQGGTILLVIFYLLVFGPVWPSVLVVLLGAVEQFAGIRRRLIKTTEQ